MSNCLLTAHAYLILLRVEVAAFHRNLIRSSLWPWSSPHDGWPLAITLLFGARTFLPLPHLRKATGDCPADFETNYA